VLINNAGIFNMLGLEETSEELWGSIVNINQKGVWLGMKECINALRRRRGGSIVNISSVAGLTGSTGSTAYHCTKGAVRLLTKAAAVQYGPEGDPRQLGASRNHQYADDRYRPEGAAGRN